MYPPMMSSDQLNQHGLSIVPDIEKAFEMLEELPKIKACLEQKEVHIALWGGLALNYIKTKKNILMNKQLYKYLNQKSIRIPLSDINFYLRLFNVINSSETLRSKNLSLPFFRRNRNFDP